MLCDADLRVSLPAGPRVRQVLPDHVRPQARALSQVRQDGDAADLGRGGPRVQGVGLLHHRLQARRRKEGAQRSQRDQARAEAGIEAQERLDRQVTAQETIRAALRRAAERLGAPVPDVALERPREAEHGDVATNVALVLAKTLKTKPRAVAEQLVAALELPPGIVKKTEIAGPGFINFFLADAQLNAILPTVISAAAGYGKTDVGRGAPANVEFVSANPTGPLHVGHGRQAALGDAIASLLEWNGWHVTREFYYNDTGTQIANLAKSVQARIQERHGRTAVVPEGGHHGEYIREIAERYAATHPKDPDGADLEAVRRFAVAALREEQDRDLQAFGVKFDVYFLESSLYTTGNVDATVQRLTAAGHTYEQDGALWLRTTEFGDDK